MSLGPIAQRFYSLPEPLRDVLATGLVASVSSMAQEILFGPLKNGLSFDLSLVLLGMGMVAASEKQIRAQHKIVGPLLSTGSLTLYNILPNTLKENGVARGILSMLPQMTLGLGLPRSRWVPYTNTTSSTCGGCSLLISRLFTAVIFLSDSFSPLSRVCISTFTSSLTHLILDRMPFIDPFPATPRTSVSRLGVLAG